MSDSDVLTTLLTPSRHLSRDFLCGSRIKNRLIKSQTKDSGLAVKQPDGIDNFFSAASQPSLCYLLEPATICHEWWAGVKDIQAASWCQFFNLFKTRRNAFWIDGTFWLIRINDAINVKVSLLQIYYKNRILAKQKGRKNITFVDILPVSDISRVKYLLFSVQSTEIIWDDVPEILYESYKIPSFSISFEKIHL